MTTNYFSLFEVNFLTNSKLVAHELSPPLFVPVYRDFIDFKTVVLRNLVSQSPVRMFFALTRFKFFKSLSTVKINENFFDGVPPRIVFQLKKDI